MLLKLSENTIVNTEHITNVEFTPDHQTKEYIYTARLEIVLTSVELEETKGEFVNGPTRSDRDTFHLAAASTSRLLVFTEKEAERLWDYFQSIAATIPERAIA